MNKKKKQEKIPTTQADAKGTLKAKIFKKEE